MSPLTEAGDRAAQSLFSGPGDTLSHLRSRDWSATPLGPVAGWPAELLAAVGTVLSSRLPMMIWWGPDLVQIYNEALVPLLGGQTPHGLGTTRDPVLARGLGRCRAAGRVRHGR